MRTPRLPALSTASTAPPRQPTLVLTLKKIVMATRTVVTTPGLPVLCAGSIAQPHPTFWEEISTPTLRKTTETTAPMARPSVLCVSSVVPPRLAVLPLMLAVNHLTLVLFKMTKTKKKSPRTRATTRFPTKRNVLCVDSSEPLQHDFLLQCILHPSPHELQPTLLILPQPWT